MDERHEWDIGRFHYSVNLDRDIVIDQVNKVKNNFYHLSSNNEPGDDDNTFDRMDSTNPYPVLVNMEWDLESSYFKLSQFGAPYKHGSLTNSINSLVQNQIDIIKQMILCNNSDLCYSYDIIKYCHFRKLLRLNKSWCRNKWICKSVNSKSSKCNQIKMLQKLDPFLCDIPLSLLNELIKDEISHQYRLDDIFTYGNVIQKWKPTKHADTIYVVYPSGINLQHLSICQLSNDLDLNNNKLCQENNFSIKEVIMEESHNLFVTRCDYHVLLYQINSEMELKYLENSINFQKITNFCSINPSMNHFLITGYDGNKLQLYDITRDNVVAEINCGDIAENDSTIRYNWMKAIPSINPFSMIVSTEKNLQILDYRGRSCKSDTILKGIDRLHNENLMPAIASMNKLDGSLVNGYYFCVASSHRLHLVDIRQPHIPILSWRHHLTSIPTNIIHHRNGLEDQILMSSIHPNKTVCYSIENNIPFVNTNPSQDYTTDWFVREPFRSNIRPYMLRQVGTIFNKPLSHKQYIPHIYQRIHLPFIGITDYCDTSIKNIQSPTHHDQLSYPNTYNNSTNVLYVNLAGDVFHQRLHKRCREDSQPVDQNNYSNRWNYYFDMMDIPNTNATKHSDSSTTSTDHIGVQKNIILQTNLNTIDYLIKQCISDDSSNLQRFVDPSKLSTDKLQNLLASNNFAKHLWNMWDNQSSLITSTISSLSTTTNSRKTPTVNNISHNLLKGDTAKSVNTWLPDDWDHSAFEIHEATTELNIVAAVNMPSNLLNEAKSPIDSHDSTSFDQLNDLFNSLNSRK